MLAADAEEVPTELVAVTVKVYAVPLVRPDTVAKVPLVVAVMPPGLEVTVYDETGLPPVRRGGDQVTVAVVFPATANIIYVYQYGASGAVGVVPGGHRRARALL